MHEKLWVVYLDGRVMGVVYDDKHQLHGSCVKFSQTAVLVVKSSARS